MGDDTTSHSPFIYKRIRGWCAQKNLITMKKFFTLAVLASAMMFSSCSSRLVNTATHNRISVLDPVVAVFADLKVSPTKIEYSYVPTKTVANGGAENIVNTAIREALLANGNSDVMVALENQIKYASDGTIESVTITGYPAKYVNFRSPGDEYLREVSKTNLGKKKSAMPAGAGGVTFLEKLMGK